MKKKIEKIKCHKTLSGQHIFHKMGFLVEGGWKLYGYSLADDKNSDPMVYTRCIVCGLVIDN